MSNVGTFESYEDDEEGICSLAENKEMIVFAYPSRTEGYINIMRIKDKITDVRSFFVHNKKIACIELNKKGDKLLSSSIGGTLIRLFDTITGDILDDFKRGNDKAQIYSLSFSSDDKFICCSSDKGTIHIFKRNEYDQDEIDEINTVTKKFGKDILEKTIVNRQQATNITKSRKFAFCRTNEETSFCVFNEKDEINLVSVNDEGKFMKICFDKNKGGETNIEQAFKILCPENLAHLKP